MSDYKRLTGQEWSDNIDLTQELGYSYIYKRLYDLENKIQDGTLTIEDKKDHKVNIDGFRPCPFCGDTNIELSIKAKSGAGRRPYYIVSTYCRRCNAYGPRVLYKKMVPQWEAREQILKSEDTMKSLKNLWNFRPNN